MTSISTRTIPLIDIRHPTDIEVRRIYDEIRRSINSILEVPYLNGQLIRNISIPDAQLDIAHTLDRPYVGWWLVDLTTDSNVFRITSSTADPKRFISLRSKPLTVASIWIF